MSARVAAFGLLLVLPLVLAGCVIPTDRDIASKLEDALKEKLHPQSVKVVVKRRSIFSTTVRKLDVTISGFTTDSMPLMADDETTSKGTMSVPRGVLALNNSKKSFVSNVRIVNAHIRCENFTVKRFPIKSMDIKMHDVRVPLQGKKIAIESAKSSSACVVFNAAGVTQFLKMRRLPVSDPKVRLTKDGCIVNAKITSFFNTPVELSGRIRTKDQAVLFLDQPRVRVSAVTLPSLISDQLIKNLNPLADLNSDFDFPVPVTITKTTHGDDQLVFDITLHFPQPGKR